MEERLKRRLVGQKNVASFAKEVKEAHSPKRTRDMLMKLHDDVLCVPSGSTLINCACTNTAFGGYAVGKLINIIGDSSSGKTLLALTMLAEACNDIRFDSYQFFFDDVEASNEFNITAMFGEKLFNRIRYDILSDTAESFYSNILKLCRKKKPFIYIVDSWDALCPMEDEERQEQFIKNHEKVKGTYGAQKQKLAGEIFRNCVANMKEIGALLIVLSQTRMNLNAGLFGNPKIRSGGMALKFYAAHEVWLSIIETLKTPDKEKYGMVIRCRVTKNKLTGREVDVEFPILYRYGVDDITSCIDYLLDKGHWKHVAEKEEIPIGKKLRKAQAEDDDEDGKKKRKKKGLIDAPDLVCNPMKFEQLVDYIEDNSLEQDLKTIVDSVWKKKDIEITPDRKLKYQ